MVASLPSLQAHAGPPQERGNRFPTSLARNRRELCTTRSPSTTISGTNLASLLIHSGADVKVVQARPRHASAKTTLYTYGHLWHNSGEATRAAIGAVFTARS